MADTDQGYRRPRGQYSHKRPRDEIAEPRHTLLSGLFHLGDDAFPELQLDQANVLSLVAALRRDAQEKRDEIVSNLIDCALGLPSKTPVYGLVIGLLNVDDHELVQHLLLSVEARLSGGVKDSKGLVEFRLLLRLLACLTCVNVIDAAQLLSLITQLVQTCVAIAEEDTSEEPELWQPYTDQLLHALLTAIPFCPDDSPSFLKDKINGLMDACHGYVNLRRMKGGSLRPFLRPLSDEDTISLSDMGETSFVTELVAALEQIGNQPTFGISSIPRLHASFEMELANGQLHQVPDVKLATSTPFVLPAETTFATRSSIVQRKFPARRTMQLLDKQHTDGDRPTFEKFIVEDYILDTMMAFEDKRAECARRLAQGLPVPFAFEPLLCQTVFCQMLGLPKPQYRPVMYSALMADLCKLCKLFPRAMSACVRECFARMATLDVNLTFRLAEWLAYHLSCFEFVWPWARWEHVLSRPSYDRQRQFCVLVIDKLIRLSYWERIKSVLPEDFQALLPPKPEPTMKSLEHDSFASDIERRIRAKVPAEEFDEFLQGAATDSQSADAVTKIFLKVLLVTGSKSFTHMLTLLERYIGPLAVRVKNGGLQVEMALIDATSEVWSAAPQRIVMVVDRLMSLRLVSGEAVTTWVANQGICTGRRLGSEFATGWEVLHCALDRLVARVQDAEDDMRDNGLEGAIYSREDIERFAVQSSNPPEEVVGYMKETFQDQQGAFSTLLKSFIEQWESSVPAGSAPTEEVPLKDAQLFKENCLTALAREYRLEISELGSQQFAELLNGMGPEIREVMASQGLIGRTSGERLIL